MRVVEIELYKFNELSEEAQKYAMDQFEYTLDYEWYDYYYERAIESLEEKGIEVEYNDITFSLFGQGSHLSFDKVGIDFYKVIKDAEIDVRLGLLDELINYLDFDMYAYNRVDCHIEFFSDSRDRTYNYFTDIAEELSMYISDILEDVSREVKSEMEEWVLYTMSDKFKYEYLSDDDYVDYRKDGRLYD